MIRFRFILLVSLLVAAREDFRGDEERPFEFRGVLAGQSTEAQLLGSAVWGTPANRVEQADGLTRLDYQVGSWKGVVVMLENGVVRSVDATPPAAYPPQAFAEALKLGTLTPIGELPAGAEIGPAVEGRWKPLKCGAGRVVLFTDLADGKPVVALMRLYSTSLGSALEGATPDAGRIAQAVASLLPKYHVLQHPLDDAMARRWFDQFLRQLDPQRIYFTQADVERFAARQGELDDLVGQGDVEFAYEVFRTLLERVEERTLLAKELLSEDHDFSVDERIAKEPNAVTFARDDGEVRETWRKRIKHALLLQRLAGGDEDEARSQLKRQYDRILQQKLQVDDDELLETYLSALADVYDVNSAYLSPKSWQDSLISLQSQLVGIGAQLRERDGYVVVDRVVAGGPAAQDGRLQGGDKILGVGQGDSGRIEDVVGMKLGDVVKRIRGEKATVVQLQVSSAANGDTAIYDLVRDTVDLQGVRGRIVPSRRPDGRDVKIGYVYVPSLYGPFNSDPETPDAKNSTSDVRRLLTDPTGGLKAAGGDVVVLDLRTNSGGSLNQSIGIAELFLAGGTVLQIRDQQGKVSQYAANKDANVWSGPVVVLVSKATGSGAEIIAGALQDHARGLIVGDRTTFGNGTIANTIDIGREAGGDDDARNWGMLRVTVSQIYRPSGDSIQKRGVIADIELPWLVTQAAMGQESLVNALEFDRVDPAVVQTTRFVNNETRRELTRRSQLRREKSESFQRIVHDLERYRVYHSQPSISLNEGVFRAEQTDIPSDSERWRQVEDGNIFDGDAYLDEVLHITADYVELLGDASAGN